jgi:hypothetical protein
MLMLALTPKSEEKDFPIGVQKGKQKDGVETSREVKRERKRSGGFDDLHPNAT